MAGEVPELKKAILMLYYGTGDEEACAASYDATTQRVREAFPGVEVRECFTSRSTAQVMTRHRHKPHLSLREAMTLLEQEGYNSVIAVSGELIEDKIARLSAQRLEALRPLFFEVKETTPLLYTAGDCRKVMDILVAKAAPQSDEQVVFVSHGKNGAFDDVFCLADYILQNEGHANCHIGTVEGYPSIDTIKQILKASGTKKVVLMPLMITGGGHAKRFVATTWREALEAEGYSVRCVTAGVLEYPEIQQIMVDKIKQADEQP